MLVIVKLMNIKKKGGKIKKKGRKKEECGKKEKGKMAETKSGFTAEKLDDSKSSVKMAKI